MATRNPKAAGPATKGIKAHSKPASFWRGGLQFTQTPRIVPLIELSEEQAEKIMQEAANPNGQLVAELVDIEPAKP